MFSRYRIYHFEDFMCVLPVSIVNGKTPSVFRGFFCKMCLADFQDWLFHKVPIYLESHRVCPLVRIGTPDPLSHKRVWGRGGRSIFMAGVPVEGNHTWEPRFCDGCTRWGDSDLKAQVLWPVYQLRDSDLKNTGFVTVVPCRWGEYESTSFDRGCFNMKELKLKMRRFLR